MKLFELDNDGFPVATAEARATEPFKQILRRVRKGDGDADGRNKIYNLKELAFIYFMGVYDSRFKLIENQGDKIKAVKKIVGLPENWDIDKLVLDGIAFFVDSQVTASTEMVESMGKALTAMTKYFNAVYEDITNNSKKYKPREIKEMQDVFANIPKMQESYRQAREVLNKEQDAIQTGRKGRQLGEFELDTPDFSR